MLPSYNIGNGRVQGFFERLIGAKLRDANADAMASLRAHVERRNRIAHGGELVSEGDAKASLSAVITVSQLVHELSDRSLGLDGALEEEARQCQADDDQGDEGWA